MIFVRFPNYLRFFLLKQNQRFQSYLRFFLLKVPASQIIDPESKSLSKVRMWHDQLFAKPAGYGGCVAWHQDFSYWTRTYPMQHLTVIDIDYVVIFFKLSKIKISWPEA